MGIKITNTSNTDVQKTTESNLTDQEENYVNVDESQSNKEECTEVNYQIIHPEDLNLKRPVNSTHLPKGRPKKKQSNHNTPEVASTKTKSIKCMKSIRTRSGRITKPPKHFEKVSTSCILITNFITLIVMYVLGFQKD